MKFSALIMVAKAALFVCVNVLLEDCRSEQSKMREIEREGERGRPRGRESDREGGKEKRESQR